MQLGDFSEIAVNVVPTSQTKHSSFTPATKVTLESVKRISDPNLLGVCCVRCAFIGRKRTADE